MKAEISKKHGDFLYDGSVRHNEEDPSSDQSLIPSEQGFSQAIDKYIETIGVLNPSYVI